MIRFYDLFNIFKAPASVHFQPATNQTNETNPQQRFRNREGLRFGIGLPIFTPGIPSTQPVPTKEQDVAPDPIIPSNQTWRGRGSPGGIGTYSPKQPNSAQTGGQPPIYSSPRIKTRTQQVSNKVLIKEMIKVRPQEPQPIVLTQKMLHDYLNKIPMEGNVRETIDNLRRRRK